MRTSSPRQLELAFDGYAENGTPDTSSSAPAPRTLTTDASSTAVVSFRVPSVDGYGAVYAMTSRMAGRLNAASVSRDEEEGLLKERQALLDRKYNGVWTAKDANRLQYVRWSLDRIEDARSGPILDAIEDWVVRYENFQSEIQELRSQLASLKGKRR